MHTCTRAYVHSCNHAYMQTCIHVYMHKVHTCVHAHMRTCVHAHMHTFSQSYVRIITCTHADIHTCLHAYMYTDIVLKCLWSTCSNTVHCNTKLWHVVSQDMVRHRKTWHRKWYKDPVMSDDIILHDHSAHHHMSHHNISPRMKQQYGLAPQHTRKRIMRCSIRSTRCRHRDTDHSLAQPRTRSLTRRLSWNPPTRCCVMKY